MLASSCTHVRLQTPQNKSCNFTEFTAGLEQSTVELAPANLALMPNFEDAGPRQQSEPLPITPLLNPGTTHPGGQGPPAQAPRLPYSS